jgi:hypothetical protein
MRPGTISGSSTEGACNTSDFLTRLITGMLRTFFLFTITQQEQGIVQMGAHPILHEDFMEMLPVDYVSKAIGLTEFLASVFFLSSQMIWHSVDWAGQGELWESVSYCKPPSIHADERPLPIHCALWISTTSCRVFSLESSYVTVC